MTACPKCLNDDMASTEPLCAAHKEATMEEKKAEFKGCGAPAKFITFRGKGRSRFTCATCPNESSGAKKPYQTDTKGVDVPSGSYSGPARVCGQEVNQ